MADIKKVLVAVAFSNYTQGIFEHAAGLVTQLGAEMVVASIINERDVSAVRRVVDMGYEVDGEHYVGDIKKERRDILDRLIQDCGLDAASVKAIFRVGNPVDELLKIIDGEDIDMVVMGIKGRTDLEHVFVGSVAEKLFRRSPVTVVSYRNPALAERLRKRIPN
ncbi:MAG: universal stress protein [Desulfobacteraceae bacterium]